jgi:hypothetical protein
MGRNVARAHVRCAATALYSRRHDTTVPARTEPRDTAGSPRVSALRVSRDRLRGAPIQPCLRRRTPCSCRSNSVARQPGKSSRDTAPACLRPADHDCSRRSGGAEPRQELASARSAPLPPCGGGAGGGGNPSAAPGLARAQSSSRPVVQSSSRVQSSGRLQAVRVQASRTRSAIVLLAAASTCVPAAVRERRRRCRRKGTWEFPHAGQPGRSTSVDAFR